MFRRGKTDQVYSTLQQVQRQITGHPGEAVDYDSSAVPHAPPPDVRMVSAPGLLNLGTRPGEAPRRSSVVGSPALPSASQAPVAADGAPMPAVAVRAQLQLSHELASFLVVLWLVTLAVAYVVGRSQVPPQPLDPGADFAQGVAGHRDPEAARGAAASDPATQAVAPAATGRNPHVLVLMSTRTVTQTEEQRFNAQRDKLNQAAASDPKKYKPWFAVRKTREGSLQLVWGSVDGKLGVDNDEWDWFRGVMEDAGFKGSYWLKLDDGR